MSLGDYLIQKRLQNKLTQDEAAILMHITPNRLSRIERNIGRVYADEIAALARVLEVPEVELLNEVDRYRNFKLSMKNEMNIRPEGK
ncbi:helix-turn-helix transcriptional regulator [Leuconostoc gelidum subsp. gasicomitatum]|uniref:helix-turn-helix domain-containing protein n=1 Tax=Leuconostoc gasicomitatum TaxID=115778 RepID=UPI001CC7D00B|nr:helix-turn-helix transcriptional regulator [Leuconostoc gasicomitatum]MBZ5984114.1 helix-turn-helix transcriptional regulator [Leuconostoc gasicomitatum]